MREHFHNLRALRGIACLMVVLFHLWDMELRFGLETPVFREIRWFGFAGVDIFFVLSGFLITTVSRPSFGRPTAIPGYLFRRGWRIYPAYWVAMGASAVFGGVVLEWPVGSSAWVRDWPGWLMLVPGGGPNPVIGQAWTLEFEVLFYLAFGVMMLVPPRWGAAGLCGWVGVVVGCQAGAEPQNSVAKLVVSPFVLEFLSGCLVAWLAGRGVRAGWRVAVGLGLGYAVVGVVVATAAAPVPGTFDMTSPRVRVLVFGPPSALLVYGLVSAEGRWPRKLPKWLLRVGDASYSLYLWHLTVILAGGIVGMWLPHTRAAHTLWLLGIFGAALGVGLLVYELVERPLLNLAKRRKPVPVPAPAVPDPLPVPTRRAA